MAEQAFVHCKDFQGIEFVKRLGNLQVRILKWRSKHLFAVRTSKARVYQETWKSSGKILKVAEQAFVRCKDFQGIEFVKRLGNLQVRLIFPQALGFKSV